MVVLNKIYTRTGDGGETGLGDGTRTAKHSARVEAYGTVDELNSVVGIARLHADDNIDAILSRIQNDLFDLGADLCRPPAPGEEDAEYPPLRIAASQVAWLETEIDALNSGLEPLRSFVLPGGTACSAHLHHCRTVARRAERRVVQLAGQEEVSEVAIRYLNRLSDWFFVAARAMNAQKDGDVLWVPGAGRG